MKATAAIVFRLFNESFSSQPAFYFSPGRINLIGEHVDYNDGLVMPAAINKGVFYALAPNGTGAVHFYSVDYNEWFSLELNDIKKMNGWKNYVLGVVNEFVLLGKRPGGFDCVFGGNIPRGSGMSSSAAVEGGLAFALNEMFAFGLSRIELALLCQRAEHGYPGVQCDIMDQFANMMGKKDQVLLLDCRDLSVQYFPLKLHGYTIVLINSMVHHVLAAGEYNARRKQCEKGLAVLGNDSSVRSFRDIEKWEDLLAYKDRMGEEAYHCCLYVVQEIERTVRAAELLQQNKLAGFGKLMYATHEGLSKLYRVSCSELDFLVEQAGQDDAVIGARLMGGGFGGCTINIVKEDAVEDFIRVAGQAYHEKFNITPEAYVVETSDGTGSFLMDAAS